ncbi:MAG: hypothetical protein IT436_00050, partial [Phycisphaerales bacterium]|nr:hypothetical protein [Phycisphaerales bacterium]
MTRPTLLRLAASLGIAWSRVSLAQPAALEPPASEPPAVTLAGQVEVARLVDVAARRLGLNIEYDAAALKALGAVTLRLDASLGDDELWLLVNRVLAARGYTTVRLGDGRAGGPAYSVVKLGDAANLPRIGTGQDAEGAGMQPGFRTVVVRARHRPAKELAEAVAKVLSKPAGSVSALGESGLILISDLGPSVEQALAILDQVDQAGPRTVVQEIPVRNLSATQLATLFAQVAAKRDAVGADRVPGDVVPAPDGQAVLLIAPEDQLEFWKGQIDLLERREQSRTETYSPRFYPARDVANLVEGTIKTPTPGTDDRWKLVVDDLTGSLVITARPAQHEQILALLERLDATPAGARRPVRTFVIKNRGVKEIQGILEDLLQAGVLDAAAEQVAPASGESTKAPEVMSLPPPPAKSGTTGPSSTSTSAPVRGESSAARGSSPSAARHASGGGGGGGERQLVLTADEGTNTLIAVGEPRLLSQVESLLKTLDVRQPQVMLEVLMVTLTDGQTLDLGVELERLTSAGDARIRLSSLFGLGIRGSGGDRSAGDASGFTGVVLSPGEFSIIVRALQTLNEGRAVSMPKLLVGNNQAANLNSVVQQPYASVNASTTVSTTSFGGTQDAGTVVTIKPQIAEGDHLLLDYSVSLSAFLGAASNPNLPPPKQENSVT